MPNIDIVNGAFLYQLFYQIAFVVSLVLVIYEGNKRKYPLLDWLIIVVSLRVVFIAGTKVGTYSLADWNELVSIFSLPVTENKTMIGGIIAVLLFIPLLKNFLKFNHSILDAYVLALPAGMAIQRFGCLFFGCCFGKTTHSFLGITYGQHSPVFHYHLKNHLIQSSDTASLLVHPIPLYILLYAIAITLIAFKTRNGFKNKGSQAIFVVMLLCFARFITEFFREPATNGDKGQFFMHLQYVQWMCISLCIALGIILFVNERVKKPAVVKSIEYRFAFVQGTLLLLFSALLLKIGNNWFSKQETIAILIVLIPTLLFTAYRLLQQKSALVLQYKLAPLLVISLLTVGMTFAQNINNDDLESERNKKVYKLGVFGGQHYNAEFCGPGYDNNYVGIVGGIEKIKEVTNDKRSTIGIDVSIGHNSSNVSYEQDQKKAITIGAAGYYAAYDWRRFGITGNFFIGNKLIGNPQSLYGSYMLPGLSLRFGNLNNFYFKGSFINSDFIYGYPNDYIQFGFGKQLKGFKIELGATGNMAGYGGYGKSKININDDLDLEIFLKHSSGELYLNHSSNCFGVGFNFK